ncbi:MAG TPA: AAA family ATPase [Castellaniella sp.]|uniref:AAA family ATPase n=1 Tax=Castellaniella sp. TaxID=1955812 RepID=UPI002EE891BE
MTDTAIHCKEAPGAGTSTHPQDKSPADVACKDGGAASLVSLRIKHSRVATIMAEIDALIYRGSQDSLIEICGPTGVGKSALVRHMVDTIVANAQAAMQADAGLIPAIYIEAPSSGEHEFSWRLFYSRILDQLDGDVADVLPPSSYGIDTQSGRMVRSARMASGSLAALRTAVERALDARGTRVVVVDEAAHIIHQTSPKKLEVQLNTLKSLANRCNMQMVLVGSYDLYQLMSLSAQLARRSHVLHFGRYREDRPEDVRAFAGCVYAFEGALPHLWAGELMPYAQALHENTLGCVGTLNAVLTRTARRMELGALLPDALHRSLLAEVQRQQILEETYTGEAAINPGLTRTLPKLVRKPRAIGGLA